MTCLAFLMFTNHVLLLWNNNELWDGLNTVYFLFRRWDHRYCILQVKQAIKKAIKSDPVLMHLVLGPFILWRVLLQFLLVIHIYVSDDVWCVQRVGRDILLLRQHKDETACFDFFPWRRTTTSFVLSPVIKSQIKSTTDQIVFISGNLFLFQSHNFFQQPTCYYSLIFRTFHFYLQLNNSSEVRKWLCKRRNKSWFPV